MVSAERHMQAADEALLSRIHAAASVEKLDTRLYEWACRTGRQDSSERLVDAQSADVLQGLLDATDDVRFALSPKLSWEDRDIVNEAAENLAASRWAAIGHRCTAGGDCRVALLVERLLERAFDSAVSDARGSTDFWFVGREDTRSTLPTPSRSLRAMLIKSSDS
ncbi:hypothetical protein [Cupriavidus sp. D39]|uniref:hypothetical protein n=1 Tax=Cupriavidus sp. D39 TaxID=2997877 RepID=UPI00226D51AA|nr:hypothetical protein [Cupriavidus sp. D39]MCY0857549.1 hypothetical protein [Cupriavidus sp. D39]